MPKREVVNDRGWQREFDDPIPLPRGRQLVTLQDAGNYITKLPKAEHEAAEWQAAMEAFDPDPAIVSRVRAPKAYRIVK